MPYQNEHAARIKSPDNYDGFVRKDLAKGIVAILGIKDGKSELQSLRFDSKEFTVDKAKEWLKEHKFKPSEFSSAIKQEDIPKTEIKQYVDLQLEFINPNEVTQEELDGNYRIIKGLVALRPGKYKGLKYTKEVLKRDAKTYIEQPDGLQPFFKLNHSENIRDRAGPIEKSYWCEEQEAILQDGKLTNPEAITLYDAGLLTTTSSEHLARIGLEHSEPGDLYVKKIQGLANAFVTRPACKECGIPQIDQLNDFLKETTIDEDNLITMSEDVVLSEEFIELHDKLNKQDFKEENNLTKDNKGAKKMKDKKSVGLKLLEAIGLKPKELLEENNEEGGIETMVDEKEEKLEETNEEQLEEQNNDDEVQEELQKMSDKEISDLKTLCQQGDEEACTTLQENGIDTKSLTKMSDEEADEDVITLSKEEYKKLSEDNEKVVKLMEKMSDRIDALEEDKKHSEQQLKEYEKERVIEEILKARKLLRNPTNKKEILSSLDDKATLDEHLISLNAQNQGLKAALSALPEGPRPSNFAVEVDYDESLEEGEEDVDTTEELDKLFLGEK